MLLTPAPSRKHAFPPPAVLFANVIASGIKIIINGDPLTRRSRFILACSLALAFGVELVPQWATLNLWPVTPGMSPGLRGLRDAIILVISTSFTLGAVVALILNLIIPADASTNPSTTKALPLLDADSSHDASGCEACEPLPPVKTIAGGLEPAPTVEVTRDNAVDANTDRV